MDRTISRRKFLRMSLGTVGSAAILTTAPRLLQALAQNPESAHWLVTADNEVIVPTVCLLCPSGCGMLARIADGNLVKMEGSPLHPINLGALCPKGQAAPELLYNPDRIEGPMKRSGDRGAGQWESITWEEAISTVAGKLSDLRQDGHPERAALLYGETRGQKRSFLERFMAAVGSPNAVSHDSLNIEAAKLGTLFTQGIYDLPAYDLENSNYVLSFGASFLEAGRSPQRMVSGFSYLRRGRAGRGKVVVIDPRQGVTGAKADEWIPIVPGTDGALALAIANVIIRTGQFDADFVQNYSFGFDDFTDDDDKDHKGFKNYVLENYDPRRVEQITGVPATTISRIAGEFAGNRPSIALVPGKGGLLNGSLSGIGAAMAIHCLNALVGSIEAPGGILTQRYMGCQEWSPLPSDPVAEYGRDSERIDGAGTLFPIGRHAFQAVAERILDDYPVEALFLYDSNPVYETPSGDRFTEAFEKIPFIVSFATFMDESALYADLILPEPTFLERWEDDHMEAIGYPGIAIRQPVLPPILDTMNTGDFLLRVAQEMGGSVAQAFPWQSYEALLQDRLRDVGADWDTLTDLGLWLTPGYRYSRRGSDRWIEEVVGADRRQSPRDGRFDFFSRELSCLLAGVANEELADMSTTVSGDALFLPHYEPVSYIGDEAEYPFMLNVITLMSLGPYSYNANMPSLQEISGMTVRESWDSWVEMNPHAALERSLKNGQTVWVESPLGKVKTKLKYVEALRPDVVNLPHNQGHEAIGRFARDRGVSGLTIMNPASEPFSGLASYTNTRVKVFPA